MKFIKTQYRFDPETLSYQRIDSDFFSWVLKTLLPQSAIAIILGIALFFVFSFYLDSPEQSDLKHKNADILAQYELLSEQLHLSINQLAEIQYHDDNIYRVIFEENQIPSSVRQAGYGGVNRYKKLEGYKNSETVILNNIKLDKFEKQLVVQSKSFDDIVKLVINKERMLSSIPAIQPIAIQDLTRFGSPFGMRFHPIYHRWIMHMGVDLTAARGTNIYSAGNGTVVRTEISHSRRGYGSQIRIDHGYGYLTLYAHLNKVLVKVGQQVKRGDIIGKVGNTGGSTAPHLHYEVRIHGNPVNPIHYYFNDLSPEEYEKVIKLAQDSTTHSFVYEDLE
ncbi:MAG: M23 family metallopeptidase [Bacteroidales bacterium]|nr:M23 family metallopeptidase [Bacteroidales bacterium]